MSVQEVPGLHGEQVTHVTFTTTVMFITLAFRQHMFLHPALINLWFAWAQTFSIRCKLLCSYFLVTLPASCTLLMRKEKTLGKYFCVFNGLRSQANHMKIIMINWNVKSNRNGQCNCPSHSLPLIMYIYSYIVKKIAKNVYINSLHK